MNKQQKLQLIEAKKEFLLYLMDEASDEEVLELIDSANKYNGTNIDISLFEDELMDKTTFEFEDEDEDSEEVDEEGEDDEDEDDYLNEDSTVEEYLDFLAEQTKADVKKVIQYLNKNYDLEISTKGDDEFELIENIEEVGVEQEVLWEAIDNIFPDEAEEDEE